MTSPTTEQCALQLMKQKISITKLEELLDQDINALNKEYVLCGWVHYVRHQKNMIFVKLVDSAKSKLAPFQLVFDTKNDPTYFEKLSTLSIGCYMLSKGQVIKSLGKGQAYEMKGSEYFIFGQVDDPSKYPIGKNIIPLPTLRTIPHLECHTAVKSTIYYIRSVLSKAIHEFFELHDYTKVDMPTITFSECEGGCQPMQITSLLKTDNVKDFPLVKDTSKIDFSKDFFGTKASLTVSAQLELETQLPLGNVYTVTLATRGEESMTGKHLAMFTMIELEQASTGSEEIMDVTEKLIKFCINKVLTTCKPQLEYLQKEFEKPDQIKNLERYCREDFKQITHAEAIDIITTEYNERASSSKKQFDVLPTHKDDISSEHENFIVDKFQGPVIVRKYPKHVKAFYMPVVEETLEESRGIEHVDSFDILVPGVGELVGGSQRIYKEKELLDRIEELGLEKEPLEFYIDMRRKGSLPHGGMGMGFERLVMFVTGAPTVKDCVAFPRFFGSNK